MRIGRVLPPAAPLVRLGDLVGGGRGLLSPGPALARLERELREYFGVRHVFLVSSGTAALVVALRALETDASRTDVVVPAYTCFSVPAAVVAAGLRPVVCDIDPDTFDFDRSGLERTLSGRTLCVIAHHLFGIPSNIGATRSLCEPRGIRVIEDAAQAMGARARDGRLLGTLGAIGVFSVGRGKNITGGSGGILITSSDSVASPLRAQIERLPVPGPRRALTELAKVAALSVFIRPSAYWLPAAIPALGLGQTVYPRSIPVQRMSGVQAGLLRHWRERLAESNRRRAEVSSDLDRRIGGRAGWQAKTTYLRLPLLASSREERDVLLRESERLGLGFSRAYPTPLDEIPELRPYLDGQRFPGATQVAERIVTVPTHPFVSEEDRRAIAACLAATARRAAPAA